MRKKCFGIFVGIFLLLNGLIFNGLYGTDISFLFQTDLRYSLDSGKLDFCRALLEAKVDHAFGAKAAFSGRVRFNYYTNFTSQESTVTEKDRLEPELKDAYLDLYDFPARNLELRIGKQRINIGKSDFFRHLDVVNPPDFIDELIFDERLSVFLVRLNWNIGFDTSWMMFAGPGIETLRGPFGKDLYQPYKDELSGSFPGIQFDDDFNLPQPQARHLAYGSKFSTKLGKFDLTLLAVSRFNPMVLPTEIRVSPVNTTGSITYTTKRETILGMGAAGELLGLGVWGELAARKNPGMDTSIYLDNLEIARQSLITDKWFLTGSLGLDYQFRNNGPYINLELSHGFLTEMKDRDGNGINDYLALTIEKKFNADKIKALLTVGFEFDKLGDAENFEDFKDHSAWFAAGSLTYTLGNNIQLEAGGFRIKGPKTTTLGNWGISSLVYFKVISRF